MTLLWTCSTNSSTAFGNVNYSVFMYENAPILTKEVVGWVTSGILRTFGELRLHQRDSFISVRWGGKSSICVSL